MPLDCLGSWVAWYPQVLPWDQRHMGVTMHVWLRCQLPLPQTTMVNPQNWPECLLAWENSWDHVS